MNNDRYTTIRGEEGWHVYDSLDDLIVSDPLHALEAEAQASRLNRRPRVQENVLEGVRRERARQDEENNGEVLSSAMHLAIAMKKLGNVAESLTERNPRERELEPELREAAAVLVRWLEQLDANR